MTPFQSIALGLVDGVYIQEEGLLLIRPGDFLDTYQGETMYLFGANYVASLDRSLKQLKKS